MRAELGAPAPFVGNKAPKLALDETLPLYRSLEGAIRSGIVRAIAVPARGGLALALARMAMAAELGLELDFSNADDLAALPPDVALFSESLGRLVVTVAPGDAPLFETICSARRLGVVTEAPLLRIADLGIEIDVATLKDSFKKTLGGLA
jgi:phosphoribosylformylglycinamidine synthase